MKILIISILVVSGLFFGNINSKGTLVPQKDDQGEKIFKNNCASCHTGGFKGWLSGAPEIGNKSDWESSFKKDIKELTQIVYIGSEDHKLKGGCDECTEEHIKAAIQYIQSKTK